jgi:hypothetical protein
MGVGQVDLVVPGLFHLPINEFDTKFLSGQLPSLNLLLRFGRRVPNKLFDFDSVLAYCLGFKPSQKLPFASAFVEVDAANQSEYLLCKPIHLKSDGQNLFALPLEQCDEVESDIAELINDLNNEFKQNCEITELAEGHWLMHSKQCQPTRHYPHYLSIVGRQVDQYLEQSRDSLPWCQLMNEMQFFMDSHAINQKRLLEDKLLINSLWCWGAGEYIHPHRRLEYWFCDDPILNQYVEKADIMRHPLSAILETGKLGDSVCIDLRLLQALKVSPSSDMQGLLAEFEDITLAPLLGLVLSGEIQLRLRSASEADILLTRSSVLKIWRKPTTLANLRP